MTPKIELYTRTDCPYCDMAKELLIERNKPFDLFVIGRNVTRETVKEKFPQATVLPVVVIDGNYLGGWTELIDWINK